MPDEALPDMQPISPEYPQRLSASHRKSRTRVRVSTLLATSSTCLLVFLSACSTSPAPRSTPDPRIAQLERQVVEWQQRAVMGEVEAKRLRTEVKRLERELEEARRTAPPEGVGSIRSDSNVIAEGVSDSGRGAIESPSPGSRADIEEIELEEPASPPSASTTHTGAAGTRTSTTPAPSSGSRTADALGAQELYDKGYALFHQKRYAEAEQHFRRVLDQHASSNLADNALFWIGESRYARGDLSSALAAYSSTIEQFPDGNKVSHALYKAGRCLEALGRPAEAIEAYEELKGRFPGTAISDLASERLQSLPR